jgi:hypothetical protein
VQGWEDNLEEAIDDVEQDGDPIPFRSPDEFSPEHLLALVATPATGPIVSVEPVVRSHWLKGPVGAAVEGDRRREPLELRQARRGGIG